MLHCFVSLVQFRSNMSSSDAWFLEEGADLLSRFSILESTTYMVIVRYLDAVLPNYQIARTNRTLKDVLSDRTIQPNLEQIISLLRGNDVVIHFKKYRVIPHEYHTYMKESTEDRIRGLLSMIKVDHSITLSSFMKRYYDTLDDMRRQQEDNPVIVS